MLSTARWGALTVEDDSRDADKKEEDPRNDDKDVLTPPEDPAIELEVRPNGLPSHISYVQNARTYVYTAKKMGLKNWLNGKLIPTRY